MAIPNMDLNGTTQYIDLGVAAIPNSTDFTMTAWTDITGFTGSPGGGGGGGGDVELLGNEWQEGTTHAVQGSSGNRVFVLLIGVEVGGTTAAVFDYGRYGGVTLTPVVYEEQIRDGGPPPGWAQMQMLVGDEADIAAASGTTITSNWTTAVVDAEIYIHTFLDNVDQTTPTGNTSSGGTSVAAPVTLPTDGPIASETGDMIVAGAVTGRNTATNFDWSNETFIEGIEHNVATNCVSGAHKISTGAAETPEVVIGDANRSVIVAAEFNKAAAGGGGGEPTHTIIDLGNDTTPYNGPNMHISSATGRIGAYDPGTSANIFTANVTINGSTLMGDWETASSSATPGTFSYSEYPLPVGSSRILVLFTSMEDGADTIIVSATFGGESMTHDSGDSVSVSDSGTFQRVELWYLLDADLRTATDSDFSVVHTGITNVGFQYALFEYVDQTIPFGTPVATTTTANGTTSFSVGTITGTAGHFMLACCSIGQDRVFSAVDDNFNLQSQVAYGTARGCVLTIPATGSTQTANCTCVTDSNRSVFIVIEMNLDITISAVERGSRSPWDLVAIRGTKAVSGTVDVSANGGPWTRLITADTSTSWTTGTTSVQSIGRTSKDAASESFTAGAIADVRCYNRQLNQNEITSMFYLKGRDDVTAGLLARWPCKGVIGASPPRAAFVSSRADTVAAAANESVDITALSPATQAGDLIICAVGSGGISNGGPHTITANEAGWTLINAGETDVTAGGEPSDPSVWVFYRIAVASEATYQFNSDGGSGDSIVINTCAYRSDNSFVFDANSTITTGDSNTPSSPTLAITQAMLVISVAALDDGNLADMTATGSQERRQVAKVTNGDPNGLQVVVGDVEQAIASPAQTWNSPSVGEWGALTFHFGAGGLWDISGSIGSPHVAVAQATPTFVSTEDIQLR